MDILSILAIIISLAAFVFSICQFFSERNRSRKEATIHAYDKLKREVFSKEMYKKLPIREGSKFAFDKNDENNIKAWNQAVLALSQIEHFAMGINTRIYDVKTLNRMASAFLINEYSRWVPIIMTKRAQAPESKHFVEFEAMIKKLKKHQ